MLQCKIIEEEVCHPELGYYKAFGLEVNDGVHVRRIGDLTTRREEMEEFLRILARYEVSEAHFDEVLGDFFGLDAEVLERSRHGVA